MTAKLSQYITEWNGHIIPFEDRPDTAVWSGDEVFRIVEAWTTRDGGWDVSDLDGSLPQWARDHYLSPEFHTQGGDHHLFGAVRGQDGALRENHLFYFWPEGANKLLLPPAQFEQFVKDKGAVRRADPRAKFADIPIYAPGFDPKLAERGTWCWAPMGPADVFWGGGLPWNLHISWFVVWQAEPRVKPPAPPVEGDVSAVLAEVKATHSDLKALARHLGLPLT